ncbi:hypothetical protein A2716_04340 [candidate division WWE3 bacterium RIFCSPHIGHO2_01_FULL_40_23]|uniref:Uncharacterized protein n=1 Tax=candidate division WWE3 bacterium RIFCSPLOWO2_01_FULL_41_18 TaxID=1802625 RepID=A0A1F4VEH8_UNCKA|nr:MAG: hypothetical protein A2716_04340 [candidate division WWE3 bacterium RIFCSPHIGHO2_01_FULL_40_23]OGC55103.1 MAG: hypothetical protein A3A78_03950 [candidate division WWE3 bacterium RIFCSPLOWO2_01_FULL_41_18]
MGKTLKLIFKELFNASLCIYLLALLAEVVREGIITNVFNLNILLMVVVVFGILTTLFKVEDEDLEQMDKKFTEKDLYLTIILSLGAGFLIYYKTASLGVISYFISAGTAVLIILLTTLIFTSEN